MSQSAFSQKHQDLKWVLASYVLSIWGPKCKDGSNILWPDWTSWALLRYLEATAIAFWAKLGDLEGKVGYQEVMFNLNLALWVRPCCCLVFRNVPP